MKSPLVSVCIITYNHEKYIAEAIESVLMQEVDFDLEVIIADDASSDKTGEIAQSIIELHPKGHWIKYTKHSVNMGIMGNFLWVLNECKGKYIAFCEGDDQWSDIRKLTKQVDFLERNSDYVCTFHQAEIIDAHSVKSGKFLFPFVEDRVFKTKDILLGQLIPLFSSVFVNLKEKFPSQEKVSDLVTGDILLFSIICQYGSTYYTSSVRPSLYRLHNDGNWSTRSILDQKENILKTLKRLYVLVLPENKKLIGKKIADYSYEVAKLLRIESDSRTNYFYLISIKESFKIFYWRIFIFSIIKLLLKK